MCGFKLHRRDIAEGLMQSLPIVEYFDEVTHRRLRENQRCREFLLESP